MLITLGGKNNVKKVYSNYYNKSNSDIIKQSLMSYMMLEKERQFYPQNTFSILRDIFSSSEKTVESKSEQSVKEQVSDYTTKTVNDVIEKERNRYSTYDYYEEDSEYETNSSYLKEKTVELLKTAAQAVSDLIYDTLEYAEEGVQKIKDELDSIQFSPSQILDNVYNSITQSAFVKQLQAVTQQITTKSFSLTTIEEKLTTKVKQVNAKKTGIINASELDKLRKEYEKYLAKYRNLTRVVFIKPDLKEFERYMNLDINSLGILLNTLKQRVAFQQDVLNLKKSYSRGADFYAELNDQRNLLSLKIANISINTNKNKGSLYVNELHRLSSEFVENSKQIEKPLDSFKNISEKFALLSSILIKDVMGLEQQISSVRKLSTSKNIPSNLIAGAKINVVSALINDYKDITNTYLQNGLRKIMKKYNEQYKEIVRFAKSGIHSEAEQRYTDAMLAMIEAEFSARKKLYAMIFENFVKSGTAVKNTCNYENLRKEPYFANNTVRFLETLR